MQQSIVSTNLRSDALTSAKVVRLIRSRYYLKALLRLRNRHILLWDIYALLMIPLCATSLRLGELSWQGESGLAVLLYGLISLPVTLFIFQRLGLYKRYWRYAGVTDLLRVILAMTLSTGCLTLLFVLAYPWLKGYGLALYRTIPIIAGLLMFVMASTVRFGVRGLHYWFYEQQGVAHGQRVLVVGAGEAGKMVVREIRSNPQLNLELIGFVDDDLTKVDTQIWGVRVLGAIADLPKLIQQRGIGGAIIAIPSAPLGLQREISKICQQYGATPYTLPGLYELLAGYKTINRLPQVDTTKLLHRQPVVIDKTEVAAALHDTCVLVTGAGGSIGSELCRQIAQLAPARLILLGHGENSIFEIKMDLQLNFPDLVTHAVIADTRDRQLINRVVKQYRPNVIFHAAAHKHVPFMEENISEAITNNVLGTKNLLWAAEHFGVERFVLISTDKAVNPTSIMGATKRLAEMLVVATVQRCGRAYMAVRFGNVLGSRGSVIPVFQRQIAAGGPLTITHPDMTRYFMTIPEAVQLVLQTIVLGKGGEVCILDMGQPVRILDLATDLLKLSGLTPGRDIEIVYNGIRSGEKLNEELFLTGEHYHRTKHRKIFVVDDQRVIDDVAFEAAVNRIIHLAQTLQTEAVVEELQALIPEYRSQSNDISPKPTIAVTESEKGHRLYRQQSVTPA